MTLLPAQLAHFEELLLHELAERGQEANVLADGLRVVRLAKGDGTADDEHDPDGPTLSAEWSRMSGLESELVAKTAATRSALARIAAGTYGRCVRRGEPIGLDRLEARPAAELCIECAREVEPRH
ncbi:MAG: TraR/DksA family transcriptional regulator [Burkholderiaceae bacterium]|nr:TraR/DksA family transcriptional regulator [Microbacteriaceae bacterium]